MLEHPGDLDLDDPSSLPLTERPPDLPPPMAMLPNNRPLPSSYHGDARKSLFIEFNSFATRFPGLVFGSWPFLTLFDFHYSMLFIRDRCQVERDS